MNREKIHIIITGESGEGHTFLFEKRKLRQCVVGAILSVILLLACTITSGYHWLQIAKLSQSKEVTTRHIAQELAQTKTKLNRIRSQHLQVVDRYETRIAELQHDKAKLYARSINQLDKRNKIIETLMEQIGINVEVDEDPGHSGGLYINPNTKTDDELIDNTDRYLSLLKQLPINRPISTKITSGYGIRRDPINHRKAFHAGIDFKGRTGDKVYAAGNGIVRRSAYNLGFGNCIVIDHGHGYKTLYAHLSKRLVKTGASVTRGQVIGLVGNTGRSTGSHLHYEVHRNKKTIDPMKFLRIASLLSKK